MWWVNALRNTHEQHYKKFKSITLIGLLDDVIEQLPQENNKGRLETARADSENSLSANTTPLAVV
jgi:type IV secretory pathway VirB10-like protein